jgi:hypothetical protein
VLRNLREAKAYRDLAEGLIPNATEDSVCIMILLEIQKSFELLLRSYLDLRGISISCSMDVLSLAVEASTYGLSLPSNFILQITALRELSGTPRFYRDLTNAKEALHGFDRLFGQVTSMFEIRHSHC